jgi:hypothetical protein
MNADDIGPILTAAAAFVAAVGSAIAVLISAWNNRAIKETHEQLASKVQEVSIKVDGNMTRMMDMAEKSGFGQGIENERMAFKADAAALVEKAAVVAAELAKPPTG